MRPGTTRPAIDGRSWRDQTTGSSYERLAGAPASLSHLNTTSERCLVQLHNGGVDVLGYGTLSAQFGQYVPREIRGRSDLAFIEGAILAARTRIQGRDRGFGAAQQ